MTDLRPPSLLLLDVDGTILNYDLQVPDSARDAIRQARANGHRIYLCTGRARPEIHDFLWELGIDGLILGNGSYVEDEGQIIHRQVMDPDVVSRAIDWMEREDVGYYLECNSGLFASSNLAEKALAAIGNDNPRMAELWDEAMAGAIYDTSRGHDDVNKISFTLDHEVDLEALAGAFDGQARISTWSATGAKPEFGEFGQLGVHKAVGVEALASHRQTKVQEMVAFGDAEPDSELLNYVGTGVAMGNAPESLKAIADLVTDHVDQDGLAKAFRRLGLI